MNILGSGKTASPILGVGIHTHQYWELILNLTGTHKTYLGNEIKLITPGNVLIVPPGVPHNGEPDIPQERVPYTDIYIAVDRLDYDAQFIVHDQDGCLSELFEMTRKVVTEGEYNWQNIAHSLVRTILQFIDKYREQVWKHSFVADFKNFLYCHLSDTGLDVTAEIKKTGYNPDYFRRSFVAELGMTSLEYLTKLRIEEAEKLLSQTFLPICEVAIQCGFSDSFYFSRRFKQLTGSTPREYRAKGE